MGFEKTWQEIMGIRDGFLHLVPEAQYQAGLEKLMTAVEKMLEEIILGEAAPEVRITGKEVREWPRVMSLRTRKVRATTEDTEGTEGKEGKDECKMKNEKCKMEGGASEVESGGSALTPRAGTRVGPLPEGEGGGCDGLEGEIEGAGREREGDAGGTPALRREGGARDGLAARPTNQRTYLWEPVRVVCRRLEISHSMLSFLSKEYSGMAAHEIGDRIKARKLKEKFWLRMRAFALKIWGRAGIHDFNEKEWEACARCSTYTGKKLPRRNGPYFCLDSEQVSMRRDPYSNNLPGTEAIREQLWSAWVSHKRSAGFDRNVWAMECGFANWARMRRACLLEFGMTPQQMEYAIADEIADYYDAGATVRNRNQLLMDKDLPERLRPTAPFMDKQTAFMQMDPGWMGRMGELFGALG